MLKYFKQTNDNGNWPELGDIDKMLSWLKCRVIDSDIDTAIIACIVDEMHDMNSTSFIPK